MTVLLFLFGIAVAAGLFFILADILKLPRLATEKALLSAGRTEKKRMKSLDALFLGWAIKLSKFIRMDEYKRHRMERTLSAAGMDMTPEVYTAYTILKPAAVLLAVIPCLLIFPLLSPIVVLLAILLYFKESRKAEEQVTKRREKIEGELPRLPHRAIPVYMYLKDRSGSTGSCWPGIKTIAKDLKLSRSTVKRALTDLEQHGYLAKLARYRPNGSNTSNLYTLL